MKRRIGSTLAVAIGLFIFAAGCEQAKQYAGFAQLGSTYAAAVDKLLVAAGNIKIDATSEQLLANKKLATPTLSDYRAMSEVDLERLQSLGKLRAHVKLMGRYFSAMSDLATSTAPDRAATAAAGAAKGLQDLKLPADKAVSPLAKLVVSSVIRGELRKELEARQETIRKELSLQEELIKDLAAILQQDLKTTSQKVENRVVIEPLIATAAISKPDAWVSDRRKVLLLTTLPDELETASAAVKKLREAFEDLVVGKLTIDRVNSLLTDFGAVLSIAETIKTETGGQ